MQRYARELSRRMGRMAFTLFVLASFTLGGIGAYCSSSPAVQVMEEHSRESTGQLQASDLGGKRIRLAMFLPHPCELSSLAIAGEGQILIFGCSTSLILLPEPVHLLGAGVCILC